MNNRATRGNGLLENLLASERTRKVNNNISDHSRSGKILDIGCGSYPYFLNSIKFKEKYGLDKIGDIKDSNINPIKQDLLENYKLDFLNNSFNVVTALAILEHLDGNTTIKLLKEIHKILSPEGLLIITVPRDIADIVLRFMCWFKLISSEEFKEHQQYYTKELLYDQLIKAGFAGEKISIKSFELGFNLIAAAKKD